MPRSVRDYIWYELYRPKDLQNLILPPAYAKRFEEYIADADLPHLLFYGPAGSGKTTLAQILMDKIPCSTLRLNASSEDRGIATIKGKVKTFASTQSIDGKLKIVFLDEADKLTIDAQDGLRNTMETYQKNCRFILTGNYIDKFTDAIKSRCTMFEFKEYPRPKLLNHIEDILEKEKVQYNIEDIKTIIDRHFPDIRSIVNCIQAGSMGGQFDAQAVSSITVDPWKIFDLILDGEVGKLRVELAAINDFVWLYRFLEEAILSAEDFTSAEKKKTVEVLSERLYRDSTIVNREINFVQGAVELMDAFGCKKISFSF